MPASSTPARISTDGFRLFAQAKTYLQILMLPEVVLLQPLGPETLEVFRCYRISGNRIEHEASNVDFQISAMNNALVLNDIFLSPEFGISVAMDTDMARFELTPAPTPTSFSKILQFKTIDGFPLEPTCYFKLL